MDIQCSFKSSKLTANDGLQSKFTVTDPDSGKSDWRVRVNVCFPTYSGKDLTEDCIKSLVPKDSSVKAVHDASRNGYIVTVPKGTAKFSAALSTDPAKHPRDTTKCFIKITKERL